MSNAQQRGWGGPCSGAVSVDIDGTKFPGGKGLEEGERAWALHVHNDVAARRVAATAEYQG